MMFFESPRKSAREMQDISQCEQCDRRCHRLQLAARPHQSLVLYTSLEDFEAIFWRFQIRDSGVTPSEMARRLYR